MTYSLNSVVIEPSSKTSSKNAVILCHGYGGDGNDISILANYWKNFLPSTLFLCPEAPEICKFNPFWYMIDGIRMGFIGKSDGSITTGIIYLLIISIILFASCTVAYKKGWKNLKN